MAWFRQVTSHYLRQYWPSSMSPYGVTKWSLNVLGAWVRARAGIDTFASHCFQMPSNVPRSLTCKKGIHKICFPVAAKKNESAGKESTANIKRIKQPRYPRRNLPLKNYCEVDEPDEDDFICKEMNCCFSGHKCRTSTQPPSLPQWRNGGFLAPWRCDRNFI